MNWILAIAATVVSYAVFSYFGMRTGVSSSFKDALLAPFTSIIDFSLIMIGSTGFGVATYFALKSSPYAIPIIISLGLIVSFIFSVIFLDVKITPIKLSGVLMIVVGVMLVK